jgi:copper chaperone CopZ
MEGRISRRTALALIATAAAGVPAARAQQATTQTTVQVKDMHCANCARKIAGRLYTVAGVQHVYANLGTHRALVTPQPQKNPSPRALWDAVVVAGFQPVWLSGPQGRFTARPDR